MSLDLINHKETTSTVDANGITWWSNPVVNVTINSIGDVQCNECSVQQNISKTYTIKLNIDGKWIGWCASFNSLFCRIVLGKSLVDFNMKVVDSSKPYSEDNIVLLERYSKKVFNVSDKPKQEVKLEGCKQELSQYYTHLQAKEEYVTEDGGVFPSMQLAEWHQEKVSKGKGNAQVVLDFNGGWILAEQIFLQEVVYRCDKPYEHFKDVMESNKGIIYNVQKEECVFENVKGFSLPLHGLQHLEGLKCSKHQAEKINEKLSDFVGKYKSYVDSWDVLSKLVSPFK